jgi:hypothetical protein
VVGRPERASRRRVEVEFNDGQQRTGARQLSVEGAAPSRSLQLRRERRRRRHSTRANPGFRWVFRVVSGQKSHTASLVASSLVIVLSFVLVSYNVQAAPAKYHALASR